MKAYIEVAHGVSIDSSGLVDILLLVALPGHFVAISGSAAPAF